MADRVRSVIELQQDSERASSQNRYLICWEQSLCWLKDHLSIILLTVWNTWMWEDDSQLHIEDIIHHCHLNSILAVLYFYFDFNDVEKQEQEKMIRSLILQLSSQCESTSQGLEALHSSCMNDERQPMHDKLLATLHQMMKSFEKTFVILDALDECSKRRELLEDIEEIYCWTNANLHILSTSRREKDIEDRIEPLAHDWEKMSIDSVRVNDDIRAYVHERLQTDPELKRWRKEPNVQQEIENTLMNKVDEM